MLQILFLVAAVALGHPPSPTMTLERLAQLLDDCDVIPPRECGIQKVVSRSHDGAIASDGEYVFFTTDDCCSQYYYSKGDFGKPDAGRYTLKFFGCRNPQYGFSLAPIGDTYALSDMHIARRTALHTKRKEKHVSETSPGSSEAEVDLYNTFSSLVCTDGDRFSDLIRDPGMSCVLTKTGEARFTVTGTKPQAEEGEVARFSATFCLSRDGKYAYVVDSQATGTLANQFAGQRKETKTATEVEETQTHPRLLSSRVRWTNLSANPPRASIQESRFQYGPEFVRGHEPVFRLTDFGMFEPGPEHLNYVQAEAAPVDDRYDRTYLWLFVLVPVGLVVFLLGRQLRRPPPPPATETVE